MVNPTNETWNDSPVGASEHAPPGRRRTMRGVIVVGSVLLAGAVVAAAIQDPDRVTLAAAGPDRAAPAPPATAAAASTQNDEGPASPAAPRADRPVKQVLPAPRPAAPRLARPAPREAVEVAMASPAAAPVTRSAPIARAAVAAPPAIRPVIEHAAPAVVAPALELPRVAVPRVAAQPDVRSPNVAHDPVDTLHVHVGQSVVVNTPWPVARVAITQTDIADVEVLTPNEVLLIGNELGTTDMILWNEDGYAWHARVDVKIDLTHVQDELDKIFPDCDIHVLQSQDVLVVDGALRRVEQVEQLRRTLDSYDIKYVDKTSVAGVNQVMINVRVAEASREAIRALGINGYYGGNDFFGGITIGPSSGGAINPISVGAPAGSTALSNIPFSFIEDMGVASGVTLFGGFPGSDLQLFIQALAENQYLRLLAEPTLVALSGEEASFLAGGEFPVPIVQGTSAGAGSTITIEYKEFGVRLNFMPTVLGDSRIRLFVAPEVSDLSDTGAVEIEGFRIPAVRTRRSETTLEVNSGETFVMAGLLNNFTEARNSSVPLLGELPILGSLFRSVRYRQGETELLVLVTANLVEPTARVGHLPGPGDLHVTPNDWELYVDGKLDAATAGLAPADARWLKSMGLHRLKGSGAWSSYDQPAAEAEVRREGR